MAQCILTRTEDTIPYTINTIPSTRTSKHPRNYTEYMRWTLALTPPVLFRMEPHPGSLQLEMWFSPDFSVGEALSLGLSSAWQSGLLRVGLARHRWCVYWPPKVAGTGSIFRGCDSEPKKSRCKAKPKNQEQLEAGCLLLFVHASTLLLTS